MPPSTPPPAVRPMRAGDVAGAYAVARGALFAPLPGEDEERLRARQTARIAHLLGTDPGGAWVADRDGEVVGVAQALLREGLWGLSLYAVAEAEQGRGVGRRLLDAALGHGAGARGHVVLSSERPAAMRRYARAGLDLRPCVAAAGIADRSRIPDAAARVEDAGAAGIPIADALGRHVRGAGHGRDIPRLLEAGMRLLLLEERAFAVVTAEGQVRLLAGRDDAAAATMLWGAIAAARPGATVSVDFLTAEQQWAIRVALDAGLALSPDGPVFTRGDVGPFAPYLPSGAYL
ncbi:MAG TPA: GNAT family N-acetyltransferase [Solirubrobacteraceae bacterium]|nr:GNAT family N-acetyltransferase [Solirubrobacteraceae bacterium]